jgi:hypothetical protein
MIALHCYYAGEGNSTHHIGDANRIQSTLHYKSKRALPFNKFLLNTLQKMFTIFEEENEPLSERAKVDELLTKVQNTLPSCIFSLIPKALHLQCQRIISTRWSRRLSIIKLQEKLAQSIPRRGRREDMAGEAMADLITAEDTAEVAEVVVVADLEIEARAVAPIRVIILLLNGTNYPLRNATKFARSVIRKANKAGPSVWLTIFQWNNSHPLSVQSNKIRLQPLPPILPTPVPLETMREMPLAEKKERSESSSLD